MSPKNKKKRRFRSLPRRRTPWTVEALFRGALLPWALLLLSAIGISKSRASSVEQFEKLAGSTDVYAIPPKEQLVVFSLGYRAAFADLLFAKTLVATGTHFVEHRVFEHLGAYLNGILALEPKYRDVYRFSDSLLNLSTVEMPKENLWIARDIQERGLQIYPGDAELWMNAGQFIAYLAPNRMEDGPEKEEWQASGAKIIQHACEIWPKEQPFPEVCYNTRFLTEIGEQEAAIEYQQRLLAIADDEEVRKKAMAKLTQLTTERVARKSQESLEQLERLRRRDLPAANRLMYQLLAPPKEVDECVGLRRLPQDVKCASSFRQRSEAIELRGDSLY